MSITPPENQMDDIRQQVARLEIAFKEKQSRNFQLGYPASMTLLVGTIALWIILTAAVMMSPLGRLAGFLIGCLVLSTMVICFRYAYKRWDRKSVQKIRQSAQRIFDDQFPAAESETRRLAEDILNENFKKYSLAQVLLNRQH